MDKNNIKMIPKKKKTKITAKEPIKKGHKFLSITYDILFWLGLVIVALSYYFNKLREASFGIIVMAISLLILWMFFNSKYRKKKLFNIFIILMSIGALAGIVFLIYLQKDFIILLLKSPLEKSGLIYILIVIIILIIITPILTTLIKAIKSALKKTKEKMIQKKVLIEQEKLKQQAEKTLEKPKQEKKSLWQRLKEKRQKRKEEKILKKQKIEGKKAEKKAETPKLLNKGLVGLKTSQRKEIKLKKPTSIIYIILFFISLAATIFSYIKQEKMLLFLYLFVMLASIFIYGSYKHMAGTKKQKQEKKQKIMPISKSFVPKEYETQLDVLYNLIQEKGEIKLYDVMDSFKIDRRLAEEWTEMLEKHEILKVEYPAFGSPILKINKNEKTSKTK